ncbi:UNVERIFIED_CONTAM: hypothetical protein PYX00_008568 [Menopon gallinae]|uniref:Uncharacterized protein n=1 Tax=Menopon gallinae TaxID=328185 RepID=A0AAW2HQ52_9NEOP
MSTNKGNNAEDSEETLNDYYINRNYGIDPSVIVSPSSWDDSDQELTESHSSFGGESEHKTDTHYSKSNWKEDRRQSLARIRRRSRECDDSPVETRDGSQNYSPKSHNTTETKTFSCTHTKINILQFDQNWSDWDLDDIILDIESFFIDQKGPDIIVPQLNSVSITTNYYSDDESGNIHRNLNVALPRIVEITEPRQITSTGCNEVDPSKPVQNIVKHSEDNNTNQCSTVISEITPDVVIEPNNFSAENIPTTDESSRDLHQVWSGTKSKTKDKAFEQTMSYVDSEYVRNNLRYVFCDMAAPRDSMEIATISIGNDDETLNLRVSSKDNAESKEGTSDKIESEDKINVEEYNSYCTENTPGTLRMNGNISETMVNYSHPNESAGLGNLFRRSVSSVEIVYSDMEESRDNRRSQAALKCEHFLLHDSVPRSGREIFLTNICSPRKQSTFDGNEQDINYLENSDKVQLLSSTNDKEDSSEEYFYTDRIQLTSTDETPQSRGKSDISYSSSSGQDSNNHLDMSSRSDKRNDSRSSSATFRNKIILHLDLSDNDDRGSSSSTKTSTDLKSSDSSGSSKNSEHEQSRSHRLLSASKGECRENREIGGYEIVLRGG